MIIEVSEDRRQGQSGPTAKAKTERKLAAFGEEAIGEENINSFVKAGEMRIFSPNNIAL